MKYEIIKEMIILIDRFSEEQAKKSSYEKNSNGFKKWLINNNQNNKNEPNWEGKEFGRSAESVINTQISHLNRFAKTYTKSALLDSDFSTQEDFFYLINLNAYGEMSKTDLIKKNIHEKSVGMQIINRLLKKEFVNQSNSTTDKRSKYISITEKGKLEVENKMENIRKASKIVTGNLTHLEKMDLIRILHKLEVFHQSIYEKNINSKKLLQEAINRQN